MTLALPWRVAGRRRPFAKLSLLPFPWHLTLLFDLLLLDLLFRFWRLHSSSSSKLHGSTYRPCSRMFFCCLHSSQHSYIRHRRRIRHVTDTQNHMLLKLKKGILVPPGCLLMVICNVFDFVDLSSPVHTFDTKGVCLSCYLILCHSSFWCDFCFPSILSIVEALLEPLTRIVHRALQLFLIPLVVLALLPGESASRWICIPSSSLCFLVVLKKRNPQKQSQGLIWLICFLVVLKNATKKKHKDFYG